MSLRIVFDERAIDQAAGFLADDPGALPAVLAAIDQLTDEPRPAESFPTGPRTSGGYGSAGTG